VRFHGAFSGQQSGTMLRASVRVDFLDIGTFHNMMEVNISSQFGDSGAALIHNNTRNIVGTLVGGHSEQRLAFFSPAIEYQFR